MRYIVTDVPFDAAHCGSASGPQARPMPEHVSPTRFPGRSVRRWSGTVCGVGSGRSSSTSTVLRTRFRPATTWSEFDQGPPTRHSTSSGSI
jgi:hypothetical protein